LNFNLFIICKFYLFSKDDDASDDCIEDKSFFIYNEIMNAEDLPVLKYCRYSATEPLWYSDFK
jgi:hypothetical protein